MVASDTSFVANNTNQQQMTADYSIPYAQYNTTNQAANTSNTGASLYPYNLPPQQDNNERYWGGNTNVNSVNTKRQSKR
jgi:hypothetical protein